MGKLPKRQRDAVSDVRGGVKLAVDGVRGVTDIVEAMHSRIARVSPPLGTVPDAPTRGITGLVYRSVRGTTGLIGVALDAALAGVQAMLKASARDVPEDQAMPRRDAVVSALNGVVGDHLERTGNPLALEMQLKPRGATSPHVLVLVHGLCMNDRQWARQGHDHGQALAQALGRASVYARYNSGRSISANGLALANGAPLERGGNWLHRGLGISPYVAPFTRLSGLRSAGITDLRHGNLLASDVQAERFAQRDTRQHVPLPGGVACYAVAGTLGNGKKTDEWLGDGLVPLASALGRHARPTRDLHIPPSRTFVARGVNHLDLLSSPAVYERLRRWLAA